MQIYTLIIPAGFSRSVVHKAPYITLLCYPETFDFITHTWEYSVGLLILLLSVLSSFIGIFKSGKMNPLVQRTTCAMLVFITCLKNRHKRHENREVRSVTVSQGTLHTLSEFIHTLIYQNYEYCLKNNKQHFYNFIKQLWEKDWFAADIFNHSF